MSHFGKQACFGGWVLLSDHVKPDEPDNHVKPDEIAMYLALNK